MQQRVALARALVNLPKVLLLDEPLGALDLKLRKGLQIELKQIQREVGITFVYVTHDQEEALTMSDRIAVMNRGQVEQVGDPEEVYDRPTTSFVAGFIGVSNLMPATVSGAGPGEARLAARRSPPTPATLGAGEGCAAVVRPEKLRVDAGRRRRRRRRRRPRSRAWSRARSTWGPRPSSSSTSAREVRMTVLSPTPTRPNASAARGRRQGRCSAGSPSTCTW